MRSTSTGHEAIAKGRVEAFSDGVIAVAITLLVLDLRVPDPSEGDLGGRLLALWPNLLAYAISFIAIGIMWINHHTMLRRLADVDHSVVVLNLLLLLCIVLLPFSTSLLATYLTESDGAHLAAVIYAGWLLVTSVVFLTLQRHLLLRRTRLLRQQLTASATRAILRRAAAAPPAYLLAALAGFVTPYLTLAICMALGVFYLVAPPAAHRKGQEHD